MEKEKYDQELERIKKEHEEFKASILETISHAKDQWSDERMQKTIDNVTYTDFFDTKVYKGRYASCKKRANETIELTLHSFHTVAERAKNMTQ